jgi:transposase
VLNATLWRALLGVEKKTIVEDIEYDEDEQLLVAHVRLRARARARSRCGRCDRRSPAYDRGEGRRRWRALDLGTVQVAIEAAAPRVNCPVHGPTLSLPVPVGQTVTGADSTAGVRPPDAGASSVWR